MGVHRRGPAPTCRSGDCTELADFQVEVAPDPTLPNAARRVEGRVWRGTFCHKHLQRVLPARLQMLGQKETMVVTKIRRR